MPVGTQHELVVDLGAADEMFGAAPADPMAPCFALTNGIARIFAGAEALSAAERGRCRIVVRLPAAEPAEAALLDRSLRRYLAARRAEGVVRLAVLRREGLQTLWLALGFILVCVALSFLLDLVPGEGMLLTLLRDGLVVAGWVALWRPLDLLLFDTWLLRRDTRILDAVAAMPLRVEAAGVS